MALNIDLDGFGFLESDSDASKLSPTLNKQPPVSPIESESSSGISSLDSDDLKKQLLSSPPTISQEEDHDDDEAEQSDSGSSSAGSDVTGNSDNKSESIDGDAEKDAEKAAEVAAKPVLPMKIIYQNRDILNLGANVWNSGRFVQYTVLPENNVNCFFQNRSQYWRLANNLSGPPEAKEKCACCDFSFPIFPEQSDNVADVPTKNAITDSLMAFLKSNIAEYQSPPMNANPPMPMPPVSNNNNNNMGGPHGVPNRRMYNNNNNAPYAAYQMMQQQQYQNNQNSGYYGGGGGGVNNNAGYNNQMNGGTGGGYNGTALALLNLMNGARNVNSAGAAFQATLNNSTRYFNNNNMNTNNNGFGLYKQF